MHETTPSQTVGHVVSLSVVFGVFAALMVLTTLTVGVSYFDFVPFNLLVALAVATLKATLVGLYFMHLRYDSPFNGLIFVIGLVCLGLFLAITLLDTFSYQADVQRWLETRP